jgi:hypothetical protein
VWGLLAILPGVLGAWGLKMTAEGWLEMCADRQATTAAAIEIGQEAAIWLQRSYPPDYCEREDWVTQWGIGLGLTGAGIAGVLLIVLLVAGPNSREHQSGAGS